MEDKICQFCTRCFASEKNSPWGEIVTNDYCYNCGAGGCSIRIPEWAVDMIRSNASWVGKRYYSNPEDVEKEEELKRLRSTISVFNGRTARQMAANPSLWEVSQKLDNNKFTIVFISASSEQEALEKTKTLLPFVS